MIQVIIKYGKPIILAVTKGAAAATSWIWGTSTSVNWGTSTPTKKWGVPESATVATNITPASISGTAVVGQTLTATPGVWSGIATINGNWQRNGVDIPGAKLLTYTLTQADAGNTANITYNESAINTAGTVTQSSNVITQILDATWNDFKTTLSITDSTINNAMNTYIITRKSISATASLGAYPMVGGTATTHSRNLYNPADTNTAKRVAWAGTITHSSNGVQGNGSNGTGNTFINPSTEISGDFTIIWYSRTNSLGGINFGAANAAGDQGLYMNIKFTDNRTYFSARTTFISTLANVIPRTDGCFVLKRIGNSITITRNNTLLFSTTNTGNVNINANINLLSLNQSGTLTNYDSRNYTHFEFINLGLDSTQEANIVNAVIAKETALGRNV